MSSCLNKNVRSRAFEVLCYVLLPLLGFFDFFDDGYRSLSMNAILYRRSRLGNLHRSSDVKGLCQEVDIVFVDIVSKTLKFLIECKSNRRRHTRPSGRLLRDVKKKLTLWKSLRFRSEFFLGVETKLSNDADYLKGGCDLPKPYYIFESEPTNEEKNDLDNMGVSWKTLPEFVRVVFETRFDEWESSGISRHGLPSDEDYLEFAKKVVGQAIANNLTGMLKRYMDNNKQIYDLNEEINVARILVSLVPIDGDYEQYLALQNDSSDLELENFKLNLEIEKNRKMSEKWEELRTQL